MILISLGVMLSAWWIALVLGRSLFKTGGNKVYKAAFAVAIALLAGVAQVLIVTSPFVADSLSFDAMNTLRRAFLTSAISFYAAWVSVKHIGGLQSSKEAKQGDHAVSVRTNILNVAFLIFTFAAGLLLGGRFQGVAEPRTYEDCLIQSLTNIQSDLAARLVRTACRGKFQASQQSSSNRFLTGQNANSPVSGDVRSESSSDPELRLTGNRYADISIRQRRDATLAPSDSSEASSAPEVRLTGNRYADRRILERQATQEQQ